MPCEAHLLGREQWGRGEGLALWLLERHLGTRAGFLPQGTLYHLEPCLSLSHWRHLCHRPLPRLLTTIHRSAVKSSHPLSTMESSLLTPFPALKTPPWLPTALNANSSKWLSGAVALRPLLSSLWPASHVSGANSSHLGALIRDGPQQPPAQLQLLTILQDSPEISLLPESLP